MPGSYGTAAGGDGTLSQAAPYSDQRHEPGPGLWLRLWLVRPVMAPCCILADTQPPVSASAEPASLSPLSLTLTQ